VDATVTVSSADDTDLASLREELVREPELRGRARLSGAAPEPGTMGVLAEVVTVALGPGGAAAAFSAVFITWIRQRKSTARFRVTRADGNSMELEAERISGLDAAALRVLAEGLAHFLDEDGETPEP
jgi:hypothetical protein